MEMIYTKLWHENYPKISRNQIEIDTNLNNINDNRRGLTLRFRPSSSILKNIQSFLEDAKKIESNLYFYPLTDIHLTVLTIVSCQPNFSVHNLKIRDYHKVISESFGNLSPPLLNFQGITIARNAILIKGFDNSNNLNKFRNDLRKKFHSGKLYQTIDRRYKLQTAHLTVIRFPNKLKQSVKFAKFLASQKQINFGSTLVDSLEFVYNDWYQKKDLTKILGLFKSA